MNLLLVDSADFSQTNQVVLDGRRARHLLDIHKVNVGQELRVGQLNGCMGSGIVTQVDATRVALDVSLNESPPAPLPLILILALPRPKMLRRVLQTAAAMGVKTIYLINAYRVEKSFWQSPFLQPDSIHQQLILGLEQAKDTLLPQVILKKRFKPFVEDELSDIVGDQQCYVAHPYNSNPCPHQLNSNSQTCLAIGPEGGFIDYEIEKLAEVGFSAIGLGPRILRVETALPVLLAKLYD